MRLEVVMSVGEVGSLKTCGERLSIRLTHRILQKSAQKCAFVKSRENRRWLEQHPCNFDVEAKHISICIMYLYVRKNL